MYYMKKMLLVIFFVISCPKPSIKKVLEYDYLQEAEKCYQADPLYAYNILKNKVTRPEHIKERVRLLVRIYLDQREYERALQILDSINWTVDLDAYQADIILLKTKKWDRLAETTEDDLLRGISYFHGNKYEKAIESYRAIAERFQDSPQHPDALVRIGDCWVKLGQKSRAELYYQSVLQRFPDSDAAAHARARLNP